MTSTKSLLAAFAGLMLTIDVVRGAAYQEPYPDGGLCNNKMFADGSETEVCITSGGVEGPSPFVFVNETTGEEVGGYAGKRATDYSFNLGLGNGTADSEKPIGRVQVGFTVPIEGEGTCFVDVFLEEEGSFDNITCCSCSPCLDVNGSLVGMKADCTNRPNGRVVGECESVSADVGYFPLDLSYGGASSECNAENPKFDGTAIVMDDIDNVPAGDGTDATSRATQHIMLMSLIPVAVSSMFLM